MSSAAAKASAIILAAGKSTRMKSALPKPMHPVCGRPMLAWILDACYAAGCDNVIVVVGHGKDEVIKHFASDKRIQWVEQTEQLGTGHAARMCEPILKTLTGDVFILAGDGPLIRGEVLQTLLKAHRDEHAAASMATAVLNDSTGYGRILRDNTGEFLDIVEQADATPAQLAIKEVFPSYYCCKVEELLFALSKLTNTNKKGEYYLTDIYGHLRRAGKRVVAVQAVGEEDVLSVNTRQQQADVDGVLQKRIQRAHREAGVTIVAGETAYIEAGVTIGTDTALHPFVHIGAGARIGNNCTIGPFAAVKPGEVVPDGTVLRGQTLGAIQR
jgi:bifunctional UDP-N-acetylglucosamine pyrophosphorylase/glucosamine-1-phosphate N-acetyltransferase